MVGTNQQVLCSNPKTKPRRRYGISLDEKVLLECGYEREGGMGLIAC